MQYIKITSEEVKTVEKQDGSKSLCLRIEYKIGKDKGECNVIDFEDNPHNKKKVIQKLKKAIRKHLNSNQTDGK